MTAVAAPMPPTWAELGVHPAPTVRRSAQLVYAALRAMSAEEVAAVTRDELARAAGVGRNTVSRSMADLVAVGLVELSYGPVPGAGSGCRWRGVRLPRS